MFLSHLGTRFGGLKQELVNVGCGEIVDESVADFEEVGEFFELEVRVLVG